jgi:hypothetical protein
MDELQITQLSIKTYQDNYILWKIKIMNEFIILTCSSNLVGSNITYPTSAKQQHIATAEGTMASVTQMLN